MTAVVVKGCINTFYLFIQSFLREVSGIKGNQFESCLVNSVHQSDSIAVSFKSLTEIPWDHTRS